ncbi:hypothetical protein PHISP_06517 [Aspergillus sp. HF37]|nr:hypothetical protein PHISP_06517 [Aspergillus sp. HF37]
MEHAFDLPDPSDWLNTPLSLLGPVENSLRCQVCKDFFDTPVITSCSHTFCSLCIRRCLSSEGKCPACRMTDQELKLRRNWVMQEVMEAFINARPSVLGLARKAQEAERGDGEDIEQPASKKRKVERSDAEGDEVAADPVSEGRQTRSQSKRVDQQTQTPTPEISGDGRDGEQIPDDGLVACPICNRRMKNEAVFQHLDTCTGSQPPQRQAWFGSLQPMSRAARNKPRNATDQPPDRLPALNYSILKDGVMRKKLRDLGIPDWGPRELLQRRHTEWMNLWNANCDSKHRKRRSELLHELDTWERIQGGLSSSGPANTVMRKDFDTEAWSTSHGDDFKRLIANAQKTNDTMVLSTVSRVEKQGHAILDEPEHQPVPGQSTEVPIAIGDMQKPEEPVNDFGVNGVKTQPSEGIADSQTVDDPDNLSSPCPAAR